MRKLIKGKKGGVVTNTVLGVGGLIIAVLVMFIIVDTLKSANLFEDTTHTTVRNSQALTLNETGQNFGNNTLGNTQSCVVNSAMNTSTLTIIDAGNYTVTSSTCFIVFTGDDTNYNQTSWSINSTTTYTQNSTEYNAVIDTSGNFSAGIDNISEKIPTILLIIAVVFLFGALVLLIRQSRLMGIGDSSSL